MKNKTVLLVVAVALVLVGMAFLIGIQVGSSLQNQSIPACVPHDAPWCQVGYKGLNPDPWGINQERWYKEDLERRQGITRTWLSFGTIWLLITFVFVGWLINQRIGEGDESR